MSAFSNVLSGADFDTSGIGVEVRLPLTSRRLNVSVVGTEHSGKPSVVIVELKQWNSASRSSFPDNVIVGGHELLHPSVQVGAYVDYLANSHSAFTEDGFRIAGCAFLHNMALDAATEIKARAYLDAINNAPLFVKGEEEKLQDLLLRKVGAGSGNRHLEKWINGRYRPSLKLFIDTDYNEERFFVRHAYFLGQNDPYGALKTTLKAEIDADAWASLHSDVSRPFVTPKTGRIAVKVINHLGDEVMKVFKA